MNTLVVLAGMGRNIVETGMAKGRAFLCKKSNGIDGLLVTVGLCIIALVLCVVIKGSLETLIKTIVTEMQTKAMGILSGPTT